MKQTTDTVVMVSPDHFAFNPETAETNLFQAKVSIKDLRENTQEEFKHAENIIKTHNINVISLPSLKANTPDAVFPNNWFSTHLDENGKIIFVVYPMLTPNRQAERDVNAVITALSKHKIFIHKIIDLSMYECDQRALEGTGSIVFDHINKLAYIALSPRADRLLVLDLLSELHYQPLFFISTDVNNHPIYHTNVMMSIGTKFAVVCLESIKNKAEKQAISASLRANGKLIIDISLEQMKNMAANILELQGSNATPHIFLSQLAYDAFTLKQREQLSVFGNLISIPINYIEKVGGGSVRCMLAEIFH